MSEPTPVSTPPPSDEHPDLAAMRVDYADRGFDAGDLEPTWWQQLDRWLAEAVAARVPEPNAIVLGTASAEGDVATRTVLAKGVDPEGLVFYTNYESAKSAQLLANPRASATFLWLPLQRQVHLRGGVEQVDPAMTADYWAQRPRGSQLGAWASTERPQSSVVVSRDELEAVYAEVERRFADHEQVPVPPRWGGWRLRPQSVEFWQGRHSRLHDRLRMRDTGRGWVVERLAP